MLNIKFVELRKYSYIIVAIILIVGTVFYFINGGFNLDIQFQGGSELQFQVNNEDIDVTKAEELIGSALGKNVTVQESSSILSDSQKVNIMVVRVSSEGTLTPDEVTKVRSVVENAANGFGYQTGTVVNITNIQPSIGQELLANGLKAIVIALLLTILYIAFRFRQVSGWSAGLISTFAIILDALILLAFYAVFKIKFNESVIAAVLTTMGYSINDKVIVFDRIRENSFGKRKIPYRELVNTSTNQTLSRTINTAIAALISILTVLAASIYFNIPAITNFAAPMAVGTVFGCLSSSFIAAPMFAMHKERQANAKTSVSN